MQERETTPAAIRGLSNAEVAARLAEDGPNELPSTKPKTLFTIAIEVVREPMFLLLIACGTLYLFLGDKEEAAMLFGFVFVVLGITLYQERRTERTLEALRDLSSPRARVVREKTERRIAGRDVVRDDIIILSEGDRVPADAVLLESVNVSADESLLTGECVPVRKTSWDGKADLKALRPGGDDLPLVYSGSMIVQGQGTARVVSTGERTQLGRIGKALSEVESERSPLQKETGRLVKIFSIIGLSLCLIVVLAFGISRGEWLPGILAGLTLAMATLPEEFPMVLTIFLALGAWRIAKKGVLTRKVPAVESLGATTVLCVDKTGTLTQNKMKVAALCAEDDCVSGAKIAEELPERYHTTVEYGMLSSHTDPFDPMERAIREFGESALAQTDHIHQDWRMEREYPLSKSLLAISRVWASPDRKDFIIAAKGAPEAIADLCHMPEEQLAVLRRHIECLSMGGLRLLGVAKASFDSAAHLPVEQHDFDFEFVGLIGLEDPLRASVPDAVAECQGAGIKVVMITGDYPGTAQSIARQAGISGAGSIVTGAELEALSGEELKRRVKEAGIFARVVPEQKLKIVETLKEAGEHVAMTGDGVNDAPALKAAHIGIAMGARGTDVAREASSLVLLNDDFRSIVDAVRLGRRIFDNLRKAMSYILAIHVPIAGLSLIPALFNWNLILLPVHIVFLELVIDPACSMAFEDKSEEPGAMNKPPRKVSERLFGLKSIAISFLEGLFVLGISLAVYLYAMHTTRSQEEACALTFTTLVLANLGLIISNLSWSQSFLSTLLQRNYALWAVLGSTLCLLAAALYVPFLRSMFKFSFLHLNDVVLCIAAGAAATLLCEALKFARKTQAS